MLLLLIVLAAVSVRAIIDALDAKSWGGVVIADGPDSAFGFRFATCIHGVLDGESIYEAVREVGPHAPDGSYCRLKWSVAPAPGDMFSIRWQGELAVPEDGDYTFFVTSDDGCRLYIDGTLLIDEWWDRVPTEFSASVPMKAGQHELRLDYYESVGSASIRLEWASKSISRQVIPVNALSCAQGPGLRGAYYYGTSFQEFAFERVDPEIDFDYGHGGPLPERTVPETACLEWSQVDEHSVVGRFSVEGGSGGDVLLLAYFAWDYSGDYALRDGILTGSSGDRTMRLTTSPPAQSVCLAENTHAIKAAYTSGSQLAQPTWQTAAGLRLRVQPGDPVYFSATLAASELRCDTKTIDSRLARMEENYLLCRTEVEGAMARTGESITNNIHWMRLLIPHTPITYVPAGRVWIWSSWTVFEWDGFFNALLAAVENPNLAHSMLDALLYSQQPDGNIPNNANDPGGSTSVDRSQPQVGIYCVWKLYLRFGRDVELLRKLYPALIRWHDWWLADGGTGAPRRDGNSNGLLEWGSDRGDMQNAKFESGMDDSPLFDDAEFVDHTWTMNMDCVDCSSLYALDALCLSMMARELGLTDDEQRYAQEHERMKRLINDHLWCEEEGMYLNRFWDGSFSHRMGCASFYPLIARVATPERASRMMRKLNDPGFFRGEWIIPTISSNDPAWNDQFYWRGTVWPPTNYLAYEGIKAYGFDAEAAIVAESGARLFLGNWKSTGTCRENYRSDTGEGGGQKCQSWGPLFSLISLQEFADVDAHNDGLRFGSFSTDKSEVRNVRIAGSMYDVTIGPTLLVRRDGVALLECTGPAVVRGYRSERGRTTFSIHAARDCRLMLGEPRRLHAAIDGQLVEADAHGAFTIPEGTHDVSAS